MKEKNQKKVAGFICILFLVVTVIVGIIAVSPQMLGLRFYTIVQSVLLWITTFASLTVCFLYAEAWFSSNHHYFDD